jgi:hypothetical protein
MTARWPLDSLLSSERPICSASIDKPNGVTGYSSKTLGLFQQHSRADNVACGASSEMTKIYSQLVTRRQHVKRVLTHRVIGKIGSRAQLVAFSGAAPVDAYHTLLAIALA